MRWNPGFLIPRTATPGWWDGMGCSVLGRWAELLSLLRERMWTLLRASELNHPRGQSMPGNSACRIPVNLLNIGQRGS